MYLSETYNKIIAAIEEAEKWNYSKQFGVDTFKHVSGLTFSSSSAVGFVFAEAWANDVEKANLSDLFNRLKEKLVEREQQQRANTILSLLGNSDEQL